MNRLTSCLLCACIATASPAQSTMCVSQPPWLKVHGDARAAYCSISRDGRFVSFISESRSLTPGDTNDDGDVFVFDRQSGQYERVSFLENGEQVSWVRGTALSDDGRHVAYYGVGDTLPGGVFVRDRLTGQSHFACRKPDGTPAPETSFIIGRLAI